MSQTGALLLDSYREAHARRLFWVSLALSMLVVLAFAAVGIDTAGITVLGFQTPIRFGTALMPKQMFYKLLFLNLGVRFWLAWLAVLLALISTAGSIPEFISAGAIDLYLSRPISRLRLFLTKYAANLLFVALQVTAFCAAAFVVIGIRGRTWEPAIFLAIPLVLLVYSYLFSVCVLLGMLTRSTVAAILLTMLFWCVLWASDVSERGLLQASIYSQMQAQRLDRQVGQLQDRLAAGTTQATTRVAATLPADASWWDRLALWSEHYTVNRTASRADLEEQLRSLKQQRAEIGGGFATAHRVALAIKLLLPKTAETTGLLERELVVRANLPGAAEEEDAADQPDAPNEHRHGPSRAAARAAQRQLMQRPISWVLATSLGFELAVTALAAWLFCRRDY